VAIFAEAAFRAEQIGAGETDTAAGAGDESEGQIAVAGDGGEEQIGGQTECADREGLGDGWDGDGEHQASIDKQQSPGCTSGATRINRSSIDSSDQQTQQQTGMLFIIIMQVQPGAIMDIMQSQQAWIIFSMVLSPLVQVMEQPMSIMSILHMPIMPMLQQHMHMPFIIMQQQQDPPAIIMQRFFIISALVLSSQVQVSFMPPAHFSIIMVQRGAMPMPMFIMPLFIIMAGIIPGIIMGDMGDIIPIGMEPIMLPMAVMPRSIVIVFISLLPVCLVLAVRVFCPATGVGRRA
jgi:hypothetical protein